MEIRIVPYGNAYIEKHREFASKYWTKKRRLNSNYIFWKFRGNRDADLNSFLLAIDGDKVIGQLGLVPCVLNIDNELIESQWACDLMVDESYRGKKVANLLYEHAHRLKPITLGSDPSPAAFKSMTKNGYDFIYSAWKHIFPIKIGEILKLKKISIGFLNKIYNPFLILRFFDNSSFYKIKPNDFKEKCFFEIEEQNSVLRDENFINWRFNKYEEFYNGIEIYIKNKNVFYSGYYGGTTYYIGDFKIKNILDFLRIIFNIYKRYKNEGISRIRFKNNFIKKSKWLLFFGFIKFRRRTKIVFFTAHSILRFKMKEKGFKYTYLDSDENI